MDRKPYILMKATNAGIQPIGYFWDIAQGVNIQRLLADANEGVAFCMIHEDGGYSNSITGELKTEKIELTDKEQKILQAAINDMPLDDAIALLTKLDLKLAIKKTKKKGAK